MHRSFVRWTPLIAVVAGAACSGPAPAAGTPASRTNGSVVVVADTAITATFDASGTARPVATATLSTKLMGAVTEVLVREGDTVATGQVLARVDARDLAARDSQAQAGIADAEAMQREAEAQARRIRALFADSAATRAQLDAVEAGLARANAAVKAARGAARELAATRSYADIQAPFAGVVTRRFVDPGAFVAPGAPIVEIQDGRTLRVSADAAPQAVRGLRRGQRIDVTIEDTAVVATIEGVVPSAGNVHTVNALVDNSRGRLLAGTAASLALPMGARRALLVPSAAVRREGDLTGVVVREGTGDVVRWVRLGAAHGSLVEVTSGIQAGASIVVPPPAPRSN